MSETFDLTTLNLKAGRYEIIVKAEADGYRDSTASNAVPYMVEGTEGLAYILSNDETYAICSGIGTATGTDIMIASEYEGVPVTQIGIQAFYNNESITSVTIPDSVQNIASFAFSGCTSLTSVIIGNGVTSISDGVFDNCTSLTEIVIPDSVTSIGSFTFDNCTSLTEIVIPDSVTSIGDVAFSNCTSLRSIVISDSVQSIGERAFTSCTSLTHITFNGTKSQWNAITKGSGWNDNVPATYVTCTDGTASLTKQQLTEPTISLSGDILTMTATDENTEKFVIFIDGVEMTTVTTIFDLSMFKLSAGTYEITVKARASGYIDSVASNAVSYVVGVLAYTLSDDGTYAICSGIGTATATDIVISNEYEGVPVTQIAAGAFQDTNITSVTIPDSVQNIGGYAFYCCDGLTDITVDENNIVYKSIDGNLYTKDGTTLIQYASGKTSTSFTIPDSVQSIGGGAFSNCNSLINVIIPNSVTSVGNQAFVSCTNLMNITIPSSVQTIGYGAFYNCNSLMNAIIPNSVTSIGRYAFYGCNILESAEIGNSVQNIGDHAFHNCTSLKSIVISDSVQSIGEYAFYECTGLTEVYYKGTASDWSAITIDSFNLNLTNATRYYYSKTQPTTTGNYWYYIGDIVVKW